MTTFAESDRVKIRKWLGFSAIFLQADPVLENAITSVQAIADGGSRPNDSTVVAIKDYLTKLDSIESQWMLLTTEGGMQGGQVDELKIDPLRGLQGLCKIGRMYVGFIADALATRPHRDVFVAPQLMSSGGYSQPDFGPGYPQW
jgi:hypothetical protein